MPSWRFSAGERGQTLGRPLCPASPGCSKRCSRAQAGGGIVSYYTIKRRERAEGDWTAVGTFIETEATLNNQKRGKELEFCVVAVNRTGEGVPSNSVSVVL